MRPSWPQMTPLQRVSELERPVAPCSIPLRRSDSEPHCASLSGSRDEHTDQCDQEKRGKPDTEQDKSREQFAHGVGVHAQQSKREQQAGEYEESFHDKFSHSNPSERLRQQCAARSPPLPEAIPAKALTVTA